MRSKEIWWVSVRVLRLQSDAFSNAFLLYDMYLSSRGIR